MGQGTFATQSPITCSKRQLFRTLCEIAAKLIKNKKTIKIYKKNGCIIIVFMVK